MFPLILILAVVSTASPLPPPALKEIDAGAGSGVCGRLVVHANAAIAAALHGDATVSRALNRISTVDLGGNVWAHRSAEADVKHFALDLNGEADRGRDELHRLNALASPARDQAAASELDKFSAALTEGIATERGMALDLTRIAGYIDAASPSDDTPATTAPFRENNDRNAHKDLTGSAPGDAENNVTLYANAVADLASRVPVLRQEEARAADHSVAAVNGC